MDEGIRNFRAIIVKAKNKLAFSYQPTYNSARTLAGSEPFLG
jgi:hypothetical protein